MNAMNYKKPAFWIVCIAILFCIIVAVCVLTNQKDKQEKNDETAIFEDVIEKQTENETDNTAEVESSTEIEITSEAETITEAESGTQSETTSAGTSNSESESLLAPEAGDVSIKDDSASIAGVYENKVKFLISDLTVSTNASYEMNGKELNISRDKTKLYFSYGDDKAEMPVDNCRVELCEQIDIDGDGTEEVPFYTISGARGWESLFIIGLSEDISVASANQDWPEYTCLMKKDGIVIVDIPEFGDKFAVKIKEDDYFWDENGNFLKNEYFNLDENGDYYISSRFIEQTWHACLIDGKMYFVRSAVATLGGPLTKAFICYEKYGYENGQLVLIERLYH